ncbi:MAG: hypothetical protein AB1556_16990 [Bacillota bacterium]
MFGSGRRQTVKSDCRRKSGRLLFRPGRRGPAGPAALLFGMLFLLLFSGAGLLPAGAVENVGITWEKMLGGGKADRGWDVRQTADGSFLVTGETMSDYFHGHGGTDVYLARLDGAGRLQWERVFGGAGDDRAFCVRQTGDGGCVVAGATKSFSNRRDNDVYLARVDGSGRLCWQKSFGGTGEDSAFCVRQTGGGGYIIAGETNSSGAGDYDVYLIKVDAAGKIEWEKTFGGKDAERGTCVRQTADGGYVVAGQTFSFGAGGFDVYLVKTDAAGKKEWEKTFGGGGWDIAECVEQTADGGYVVTGRTSSTDNGNFDVYLVKTDAAGVKQWEKTFGGSGWDAGKSVRQTEDGGYLVAGWTDSSGSGGLAFYLVKAGADGGKLWEKTLQADRFDREFTVQPTADGGYVVAGWWAEPLQNLQWRNDDLQVYVARLEVNSNREHQ